MRITKLVLNQEKAELELYVNGKFEIAYNDFDYRHRVGLDTSLNNVLCRLLEDSYIKGFTDGESAKDSASLESLRKAFEEGKQSVQDAWRTDQERLDAEIEASYVRGKNHGKQELKRELGKLLAI